MWELDIVKSLLAGGSKDGQEAFNSVEPPHGSIENSCYNNLLLYGFKLVANLSDLLEILVKSLIL